MKLYHGSNIGITSIDLSKSKTNKDFGCGFYLSDNFSQANDMAKFKVLTTGGEICITCFEFAEDVLHNGKVNVKIFEDYSVEWARFVLDNRNNSSRKQIHPYDIVYGPIANDRVGAQIRRLENGDITMEEFMNRLKYMKGTTFQYFFGTERSLRFLKKI